MLSVIRRRDAMLQVSGQRGANMTVISSAWLRLRGPTLTLRYGPAGKLLCQCAILFSAHQESLREGRGAQGRQAWA